MFFDGTGNNRAVDMPELKHRNVARLFDAYTDNLEEGYFGHYIAGVMAIFTEIGEPKSLSLVRL